MKIAIAGTGYVGLVTGVVLAHVGHIVTCLDVNQEKISMMKSGQSPIFEEELEQLMQQNSDKITYTINAQEAYSQAEVIFIGVGTPEREDGSANLDYVYDVVNQIATYAENDVVVVVKSTVPIGTNDEVEKILRQNAKSNIHIDVVSNPEFLAQGTAVRDTLYASRVVVGVENKRASDIMRKVYAPLMVEPYNVPYIEMNRRSAEMVKYASNDFLALKISYINEIANLCEILGANIENVTEGMSYDKRIGQSFLKAGIGYGGSCFPKDTKALHWLSKQNDVELKTIKACIEVNKVQKIKLFEKYKKYTNGEIKGKNVAVLGVTFKPKTDDLRESPAIDNVRMLLSYGANVVVYDPVGMGNFSKIFDDQVTYAASAEQALQDKDVAFIMTEWEEIQAIKPESYKKLMKTPLVYDGRNCYDTEDMKNEGICYFSIGR